MKSIKKNRVNSIKIKNFEQFKRKFIKNIFKKS